MIILEFAGFVLVGVATFLCGFAAGVATGRVTQDVAWRGLIHTMAVRGAEHASRGNSPSVPADLAIRIGGAWPTN